MKKTLALSVNDLSDLDLQDIAMKISGGMTDNEYLPRSAAAAAAFCELTERFIKAIAAARSRDIVVVSQKNDIRQMLIIKMKELGALVVNEANGQLTPLISSGFPLAERVEEVILKDPEGFKVLPGANNGEIILQVRRVIGAKSYLYQYTPDPLTPESVWETVPGTRCKKVITDLPMGVKYWFRMAAVGPKNQVVYTRELWRYVA